MTEPTPAGQTEPTIVQLARVILDRAGALAVVVHLIVQAWRGH